MRKVVLSWLSILLVVLTLPAMSLAETKDGEETILRLDELTVQVLPEYAYHPEDESKSELPVLVSYHGSYKNITDSDQKVKVEIPLPVDSENFKIGYVADYNRDLTQRFPLDYEIDEKRKVISWETSEEVFAGELYKFVIEYYTTGIEANGADKSFSFTFEKFADIPMLNVYIVEPLKTDKFDMKPDADAHQQNTFGMNMFNYQLKELPVNESITIDLNYEREEQLTTAEILEKLSVELQNMRQNEPESVTKIVAIIGGVSAVAIAILVFILIKRKNSSNNSQKNSKKEDKEKTSEQSDLQLKHARLRALLVEGKITEEEYEEMLKKLGG